MVVIRIIGYDCGWWCYSQVVEIDSCCGATRPYVRPSVSLYLFVFHALFPVRGFEPDLGICY